MACPTQETYDGAYSAENIGAPIGDDAESAAAAQAVMAFDADEDEDARSDALKDNCQNNTPMKPTL